MYQMKYPGKDHYVMTTNTVYLSPCMSEYWRSQPRRQGKAREDHDTDTKSEEPDED